MNAVVYEVPADKVVGSYACRKAAWNRANELGLEGAIFTKEGARQLRVYFNEFRCEPVGESYQGFLDVAANRLHPSITFESRRQHAEKLHKECLHRLDVRSIQWLSDDKSWESLAFLPLDWWIVLDYIRGGINSVASIEMLTDAELKRRGVGPAKIKKMRSYRDKVLTQQAKATRRIINAPRRIRRVRSTAMATPTLF